MEPKNASNLPKELITPSMAKEYLKANSSANKALDEEIIKLLVKKIKNNKWDSEGDPIYFISGNVLSNGQHRMHAIIQANTPIEIRVFRMPTDE